MKPEPERTSLRSREEVYEEIATSVREAEQAFRERYERDFNPTREEDYLDMAPLCEGRFSRELGLSNIGTVFLKNFILREERLLPIGDKRQDLLDGLVGWLNYNPPPREFELRISALKRLSEQDWRHLEDGHLQALGGLVSAVETAQRLAVQWGDVTQHERCNKASLLCDYLREGVSYLFEGTFFRQDIIAGRGAKDIGMRLIASWEQCAEIFRRPGAASYS